jgi:parallel beta-helix repeat protein
VATFVAALGLALAGHAERAHAATFVFEASDDARVVADYPDSPGADLGLLADGSPETETYVRFAVSGLDGPVVAASLRLFVTGGSLDGPAVHATSSNWSGLDLTWNSRPAKTTAALDDHGLVIADGWEMFDVAPTITQDGIYSFALTPTSSDGVYWRSKEYELDALRPQLVVTTTSPNELGTSLPPQLPRSTGTTYYVSPLGSDDDLGTFDRPWRTIQAALDRVGPGDIVDVRGGTYEERLAWRGTATVAQPVTLRAHPGEQVVVAGRIKVSSDNLIVNGLVFEQGEQTPVDSTLIYVSGAANVELAGNEIRNAHMSGIYIGNPGDLAENVQLLANWVHDNGTHRNLDHGIYIGSCRRCYVANNVINDNYAHGIKIAPGSKSGIITHNTSVHNGWTDADPVGSGFIVAGDWEEYSDGNLIVNNLLTFNHSYGGRTYWLSAVGANVARQNLTYGSALGDFYLPGGGLTLLANVTGLDPLHADVERRDFRLRAGSPAIGIGDPAYTPSHDFYGRPRLLSDLGAIAADVSTPSTSGVPSWATSTAVPAPSSP